MDSAQIDELKQKFERDGYLVLTQFVSTEEVLKLKSEYKKLVAAVEESELTKVFTTTAEQTSKHDDYFLGYNSHRSWIDFLRSADKVRFFLEGKAIDKETGKLTKPKELSINKVRTEFFNSSDVWRSDMRCLKPMKSSDISQRSLNTSHWRKHFLPSH